MQALGAAEDARLAVNMASRGRMVGADLARQVEAGERLCGYCESGACIAVGEDREQTLRLIEEAVAFHVEGLRAEGLPVPPPQCDIVQVEVDAA